MEIHCYPPAGHPPIVKDYLSGHLADYVALPASYEGLSQAAQNRNFPDNHRQTLVKVLQEQYRNLRLTAISQKQIELLLQPNTFTITTGHQLMIGGGPMFMFWKIMHTMALAARMNREIRWKHFMPVFWMATEDHDFEEIQSVKVFSNTYTWETSQTGPVGRMKTEGLEQLVNEWAALFKPGDSAEKYIQIFRDAYQLPTLSQATAYIFHEIFGADGLIILDADHPELKSLFAPYMIKDICEYYNEPFIKQSTASLSENYKTQISPREINFFKLSPGKRERIKSASEGGILLSREDILSRPENFSPNVCMRPLYQEVILPNIAYIGGPGEISYWLQLKAMFEANKVHFPVLVPRHSVFLISPSVKKKWLALGFNQEDLFQRLETLQQIYINRNSEPLSVFEIITAMESLQDAMKKLGASVDATLIPAAEGTYSRIKEQADGFVKKVEKLRKASFDQDLQKIVKLYEEFYPNGAPQDRTLNILTCANYCNLQDIYIKMQEAFTASYIALAI